MDGYKRVDGWFKRVLVGVDGWFERVLVGVDGWFEGCWWG